MKVFLSIAVAILVVASVIVTVKTVFDQEPQETPAPSKDLSDFASMKEKWTLGLQTLVKNELSKGLEENATDDLKNLKVFEIFLELVASDLTYYFEGQTGMITMPNLSLLRFILKEEYLPAERFKDPFKAMKKFNENPEKFQTRIYAAESVFENRDSYRSFCDWFLESVKLGELADIPPKK